MSRINYLSLPMSRRHRATSAKQRRTARAQHLCEYSGQRADDDIQQYQEIISKVLYSNAKQSEKERKKAGGGAWPRALAAAGRVAQHASEELRRWKKTGFSYVKEKAPSNPGGLCRECWKTLIKDDDAFEPRAFKFGEPLGA